MPSSVARLAVPAEDMVDAIEAGWSANMGVAVIAHRAWPSTTVPCGEIHAFTDAAAFLAGQVRIRYQVVTWSEAAVELLPIGDR